MLVHGADEAKAFARKGPDQLLLLAVVADGISSGVDAAVEGRVRHEPSAPHPGNKVVPADDLVAVLQEMDQQIEHLRLGRDQLAAAPQFATTGIEGVIIEAKYVRHRIFLRK